MPKTPAFIVDMKSHPRSVKHGKHRRTSPPAHGSSVDGADTYKPIRTSLPSTAWRTLNAGQPFDLSPGAINAVDPGVVTDHLKDMQKVMADAMNQLMYGFTKKKPEPIPHTDIHLGEIIGRRLWYVCDNGMLHSLAHDYIWAPGGTEVGDVDKIVDELTFRSIYGGVYAFKLTEGEIEKEWYYSKRRLRADDRSRPQRHLIGVAMGTIKMWGEVVEHEWGYRAQFAKVLTIDRTFYHPRPPSRDPYELYIGPRPAIDSRGWTG